MLRLLADTNTESVLQLVAAEETLPAPPCQMCFSLTEKGKKQQKLDQKLKIYIYYAFDNFCVWLYLQWRERSYTGDDGDTVRVYTVCNVNLDDVDNWVRTPYIARGQANRLYVEMRFTMRTCQLYPDPEKLHQCRESFKLYYYEAESDFANAMMPTWDTDTYSHADVVAADRTFEDIDNAITNVEVRSVPITRRGVYFAFHDEGACTALLSIRIYYVLCEATTVSLAVFPNTTAGPELTSIVQEEGRCVPHAAIEHRPSYLCKADGSWYYPSGGCKCMPGYEPQSDQKCTGKCLFFFCRLVDSFLASTWLGRFRERNEHSMEEKRFANLHLLQCKNSFRPTKTN